MKPSIDAVGEFKVITNNLSAEYGGRMGGTVLVTIKSGTNQLHGTAYEFLRNDKFDGTNFFANRSGAAKPEYRQNQFGGTLGGPIRKNKLFLFGSFDGTRIRSGTSSISTVPDRGRAQRRLLPAIRNIFDPLTTVGTGAAMTRQIFPGNIIPKNPLGSAVSGSAGALSGGHHAGHRQQLLFLRRGPQRLEQLRFQRRREFQRQQPPFGALQPAGQGPVSERAAAAAGRWRPGDHYVDQQQQRGGKLRPDPESHV